MTAKQIIALVASVFIAAAAYADEPQKRGKQKKNPHVVLQAQIDALSFRTEQLEAERAVQDVDGRIYCSTLNMQVMRAWPGPATEETQNRVVRRIVTFEGGVLTANLLSNIVNDHSDQGTISHDSGVSSPDPLVAGFVQAGSKVDITFGDGSTANWQASRDGSVIFGTKISDQVFGNGAVSVGVVRIWTMIESDALTGCDAEYQ